MNATSPHRCLKVFLTNNRASVWLAPASRPQTLLDGDLDFYPHAIHQPERLFRQLLDEIPWQQGSISLYGKRHPIPRLQCWMAGPGLDYRYSGENLTATAWTSTLAQLRAELNQRFDLRLNSVLCNLYRDGNDSMGWHADNEPELGPRARILSLTLGSERDFALRHSGESRQAGLLALPDGSLLDMKPGMQQRWQHAVPKRKRLAGARINLTFRCILPV